MESIKGMALGLATGQHKKYCPECHQSREKHKHDKSLSLKIDSDGVQFFCHHCNVSGGWMHDDSKLDFVGPLRPITIPSGENPVVMAYLRNRNISAEVITEHTVQGDYRFNGKLIPAVGFPYRVNGKVNAVKWRSADDLKYYSQQNVCEDFWGLDLYKKGNDLLIVEGELDALSWLSCELPANLTVLSIPNGAPAKVSKDRKISPSEDKRFQYVWRAADQLDSAGRILLCFDADKPGLALKAEIIRRLGDARDVWIVDLGAFKDTSEALAARGPAYCLDRLDCAKPLPTVGLYGVEEFREEFTSLYEDGHLTGVTPGLNSLDELIQIVPGMVTVVTGFPSSGKSDLIDQICLNVARNHGWKTVYSSFEKPPSLHLAQLTQKLVGAPFFDEGPSERMSREQRDWAMEFCSDHFLFMDHSRQGPSTIEGILEVASKAVMRQGSRILVIDPYNHLEMSKHEKETDAISKMLTLVQQWARASDAHVFFVTHPTKLPPDRRSEKRVIVTGHDIAGSAAWFAKADVGITVWRHPQDLEPSEVIVWKVRWSWLGTQGFCQLDFDRITGTWSDSKFQSGPQDTTKWDWDGFDKKS